jgi:hypothetical protein
MSFRLGIVGLCTSHPSNWVPVIRDLAKEKKVDVDVVAAWDSGGTRTEGFATAFCKQFNIPQPVTDLEEMVDLVDGVIIHSANWDKHLDQASLFISADKSVFIDKPMAGNLRDINQFLDWAKIGKRVTGGSSLRYAAEIKQYLTRAETERGRILTAFAGCGHDEFNYGIHAYSLLSGLIGPGINAVTCLGREGQLVNKIDWSDGKIGILNIAPGEQPFHVSAVSTIAAGHLQIRIDPYKLYRSLLESVLPYLSGRVENPPVPMNELVEPELAALAARASWQNGGTRVFLKDLAVSDRGYDGSQFEMEYRRARLS